MKQAGVSTNDRLVVAPANQKAELTGAPALALELPNGHIVTGKTSDLLGASAAVLLNALKELAEIDDSEHIISPSAIEPIQRLKTGYLGSKNPRLHTDEILIALSTSAATSKNAQMAMEQLSKLRGCQAHASVKISSVDARIFHKLGVQLTCEAKYEAHK